MSASVIAQSAVSRTDWSMVARQWQQAIDLLKAVPKSTPNYEMAQNKIAHYQKNLAIAQQKAQQPEKNSVR